MKSKTIINILAIIAVFGLVIGLANYYKNNKDTTTNIIDNIFGNTTTAITTSSTTNENPYTGAVITKNSETLTWSFIRNSTNTQLLYGFSTTLKPNTNYRIVYSISPYLKVYGEEYSELPGGYFNREIFEVDFSYSEVHYRLSDGGNIITNMDENFMNDVIDFTTDNTGYFAFYMARLDNDGMLHPVFTETPEQIQYHKNLSNNNLKGSDLALSIIEME